MKKWATEIMAVDPINGKLKTYGGPHIDAPTWEEATLFCQTNGLGYCKVVGQLIAEVDTVTGMKIDYDNLN
ncbi:hypothetical protein [Parapedobacter indicus]|uniref:Uncharacterized protein n=1 Tax=Parapedobacter indicus TaxID=1477437 RepID=A0A1I3VCW4_9SPHI|nr:hypothetical protein [Parapedobacter indicus]PPK98942.1 hypothetical protein CLV26_11653 [Parapedobacter indicus]SFJ92226.1 hypothetical protein SAMN05444682_11631 [Parapedobacter indicus]